MPSSFLQNALASKYRIDTVLDTRIFLLFNSLLSPRYLVSCLNTREICVMYEDLCLASYPLCISMSIVNGGRFGALLECIFSRLHECRNMTSEIRKSIRHAKAIEIAYVCLRTNGNKLYVQKT